MSEPRDDADLQRTLVELVGLLPPDETYQQTLQRVVDLPAMSVEERWGPFPSEALRHGVGSSLSLPLAVRQQPIGALNLYSRAERAYTDLSREIARLFAAQASVAVANAQVYEASRRLTEQLQEATLTRSVIEQAKGILIAERGCDEDTAFELLRAASQRQNVKLRDVAQRLVDSKGTVTPAPEDPAVG